MSSRARDDATEISILYTKITNVRFNSNIVRLSQELWLSITYWKHASSSIVGIMRDAWWCIQVTGQMRLRCWAWELQVDTGVLPDKVLPNYYHNHMHRDRPWARLHKIYNLLRLLSSWGQAPVRRYDMNHMILQFTFNLNVLTIGWNLSLSLPSAWMLVKV